ncbi:MAG: YiiX/YebB-like N1pC/P60 family cysteine hydrolase [Bdellovibrionota bacterium]
MKNIKQKISVLFLFSALTITATAQAQTLKVGDVIFHKSQSQQAKAITEASGSEWTHVGILVASAGKWYVAEAIGPVKATPLQDFINRGKNKEYKIYRFKHFNPKTMELALHNAIKRQNKPYDIYFEMSDARTYCSELVYKAMLEVTGKEVGTMQKFKDLKLTGPYVKALIKKRLTDTGRELDPNEPIITPISQMRESDFTLVKQYIKSR